ncbi:hypothetical protein D3C73_1178820 [compost metagenome]
MQLHRLQAPGQVGLTIGRPVALGITEAETDPALGRHGAAVVDPLLGLPGVAAFAADRQTAVQVERDHPLRLHRPIAVADFTVGRQIETAVVPQRFAPRQVEQAGARIIGRAHVKIASAEAAPAVEVDAQGRLFAALAQGGERAVDDSQVGVAVASLQTLVREAVALAAVLIAEADLLATVAVEPALADGRVQHAEIAQAQVATDAAQGERVRGLGMAFQGEVVAEAVT